jgi:hypothetical protein
MVYVHICILKIPIFEGVGMENFGSCNGHLEYFMVNWYIVWSFGIHFPILVYIFPFWYVVPKKSGHEPDSLSGDAPQEALALIAVGGRGGRPEDEVVRRRARDGVDERLQGLLVHVKFLKRKNRKLVLY